MSADLDPFALARQGEDDAQLFALITEYRRVERDDPDNDTTGRLVEAFKKIDQIRPVTVRGVSAVLDLYCEDWLELGWQPDNAIAALREIVARGGRP